ncbi:MAG: hypothetical protein WC275_01890 [Bacilli bacterium]
MKKRIINVFNLLKEKIKNLFYNLTHLGHRSYVFFALFVVALVLTLVFKIDVYKGLLLSIKNFLNILIKLITFSPNIPGVSDKVIQYDFTIPKSISELIYSLRVFSVLLFNEDYFIISSFDLVNFLINTLKFIVWLPFLVVLIILIKAIVIREDGSTIYEETKALTNYKKLELKYIIPIKNYFESWRIYLKYEARFTKLLFIILILIFYRIGTLAFDLMAWYLYFIRSFDFSSIVPLLTNALIEVLIFTIEYNLIYKIIPVVILIRFLRHKRARDIMSRMQYHNEEVAKSNGIITMFFGPPGIGKTKMNTSVSMDTEKMLRNQAYDIMKKYQTMFPDFSWARLRTYIDNGIKDRLFVNRAQLKAHLETKFFNAFDENVDDHIRTEFYNIFKYDLYNRKVVHFDGIKYIDLFKAMSTYAESFFLYNSSKPLSFGNYSIRYQYTRFGKFPVYNYDYINADKEQFIFDNNSHIINYNSRRLFEIVGDNNNSDEYRYIMDGHVEHNTEISSERGNRNDHKGQSKDDYGANQVNDGYNTSLKLSRHEYSIDGKPFVRVTYDLQRLGSLNLDLVETAETFIEIKGIAKVDVVLPSFEIDYLICNFVKERHERYMEEFLVRRNTGTLYNYLLDKIVAKFNHHWSKIKNMYGYEILEYVNKSNSTMLSTELLGRNAYYILNQKMYADTYATDAYKEYFNSERLKATKGMYDAVQYETYTASVEELDQQNSFMINNLKRSTKTTVANDKEETDTRII